MIKILATSDWHLGNNFHGFDRLEEHRHFLVWLLGEINRKKPDVLLVAGDVFDSGNPSAAAQELYYSFLDEVSCRFPDLQIVIIAGNHDSAARLEAPRLMLERHRVFVRGVFQFTSDGAIDKSELMIPVHSASSGERAWVLAVPYLRESDLPKSDNYGSAVSRFLSEMIEYATRKRSSDKEAMLLMAHFYARGGEIAENSSERIVIGGSEVVGVSEVTGDVTLALVGHLHRNQHIEGKEHWVYPGSALPMSFAERHYRHGAVYYEIENGQLKGEGEFLSYQLQHPLLSLPERPRPLAEVIELLNELPDSDGDDGEDDAPYLEVNVLLTEADPSVQKRVTDITDKKKVRLCRVPVAYQSTGDMDDDVEMESIDDLLTRNPIDFVKQSYKNKYGFEMSDELTALARIAIEAARKEEEGGEE